MLLVNIMVEKSTHQFKLQKQKDTKKLSKFSNLTWKIKPWFKFYLYIFWLIDNSNCCNFQTFVRSITEMKIYERGIDMINCNFLVTSTYYIHIWYPLWRHYLQKLFTQPTKSDDVSLTVKTTLQVCIRLYSFSPFILGRLRLDYPNVLCHINMTRHNTSHWYGR